jgi:hypothetical protein
VPTDLHYIDGEPTSFVVIKKEEDLDMMAEYDMMTHNPFVYGVRYTCIQNGVLHNVSYMIRVSKCFKMLQDVSKCFKKNSKRCKMSQQTVSRCPEMFLAATLCMFG